MFLWTRGIQFWYPNREFFDKVLKTIRSLSEKDLKNEKFPIERFFHRKVHIDEQIAILTIPSKNFRQTAESFSLVVELDWKKKIFFSKNHFFSVFLISFGHLECNFNIPTGKKIQRKWENFWPKSEKDGKKPVKTPKKKLYPSKWSFEYVDCSFDKTAELLIAFNKKRIFFFIIRKVIKIYIFFLGIFFVKKFRMDA